MWSSGTSSLACFAESAPKAVQAITQSLCFVASDFVPDGDALRNDNLNARSGDATKQGLGGLALVVVGNIHSDDEIFLVVDEGVTCPGLGPMFWRSTTGGLGQRKCVGQSEVGPRCICAPTLRADFPFLIQQPSRCSSSTNTD